MKARKPKRIVLAEWQNVPRREVRMFAKLMEWRLRENDHKPGWKRDEALTLAKRIRAEWQELVEAILDGGDFDVIRECADVANFAMMVADVSNGLEAHRFTAARKKKCKAA